MGETTTGKKEGITYLHHFFHMLFNGIKVPPDRLRLRFIPFDTT